VQQWTVESSVTHLRNYISQLDVTFEDIQRYLVYRIPGAAEPVTLPTPSAPVQELPVHTEQIEANTVPEVNKCVSYCTSGCLLVTSLSVYICPSVHSSFLTQGILTWFCFCLADGNRWHFV